MKLSRYTLKNISNSGLQVPAESLFELPEKVLQFGTGVLLRALPDYFIDKANRQGIFNGRIVVVKSTTHGDTSAFEMQDSMYTHCIRGFENGTKVEENIINSSISRVMDAHKEWEEILECAHNQAMQVIISNTTEVGIQLINDDIRRHPPVSFPGKLLAFLYERFQAFGGSAKSGMVIVPTELIIDNGKKLESIVLELAHLNNLEDEFIEWLESSNCFCNSLVDRIVPGKPDTDTLNHLQEEFGYKDDLLVMSEVYRLWAIEGDAGVKEILSFAQVDEGVVIEKDIELFRELKLRLLNGTHTLSCGVAFLSGMETVQNAMEDENISTYIAELMQNELAPSIPYPTDFPLAREFGNKVLDRFRNTQIRHQWISITAQYSSKMKSRCIPLLINHYQKCDTPPELFVTGFAAYLAFIKPVKQLGDKYFGMYNDKEYQITDDMAPVFFERWKTMKIPALVQAVLKDSSFWGEDLSTLPGFKATVIEKLTSILHNGMKDVVENVTSKSNSVV